MLKKFELLFFTYLLLLKKGTDSLFKYIFMIAQYNKNQAKLSKLLCHDKNKYTRHVMIKTRLRSQSHEVSTKH